MSFNSLIIKPLMKKVNPFIILFYQYLMAVPLVLTYSYFFNTATIKISELPLILLGIIYVIALSLYYIALNKGPLSKVGPVFNLKMIITAILGLLVLFEPLTIQLVIGLIFGVLGVYLLGGEEK
jgi:drug/metabolite transporter (DMT)-like permease